MSFRFAGDHFPSPHSSPFISSMHEGAAATGKTDQHLASAPLIHLDLASDGIDVWGSAFWAIREGLQGASAPTLWVQPLTLRFHAQAVQPWRCSLYCTLPALVVLSLRRSTQLADTVRYKHRCGLLGLPGTHFESTPCPPRLRVSDSKYTHYIYSAIFFSHESHRFRAPRPIDEMVRDPSRVPISDARDWGALCIEQLAQVGIGLEGEQKFPYPRTVFLTFNSRRLPQAEHLEAFRRVRIEQAPRHRIFPCTSYRSQPKWTVNQLTGAR